MQTVAPVCGRVSLQIVCLALMDSLKAGKKVPQKVEPLAGRTVALMVLLLGLKQTGRKEM